MRGGVLSVVVLLLVASAACGVGDETVATGERATPTSPQVDAVESCDLPLVAALDVTVVGSLTDDQRGEVDWALQRFDEAGLLLPQEIEVEFDPTRVRCGGDRGVCLALDEPPAVRVCEAAGDTAFRSLNRRVTLLHELAHVWFALASADHADEIVGGVAQPDDGVPWADRTAERVAVVVAWGLLDQPRRPVVTNLPCVDLYRQFVALTGTDPLGPLEPICVPE